MIKLRQIRSFIRLNNQMKCLVLESFIMLAWARYKKSKNFSDVASTLGERMTETTFQINVQDKKTSKLISRAIHLASPHTFWESQCLVKAMAGMKMLERRGIESTLYLGTAKDETGLIAHSWLRSGDFYVSGAEVMERFTVVEKFAKVIKNNKAEGENYG